MTTLEDQTVNRTDFRLPTWSLLGLLIPAFIYLGGLAIAAGSRESGHGWAIPIPSFASALVCVLIGNAVGTLFTVVALIQKERPLWVLLFSVIFNFPVAFNLLLALLGFVCSH